MSALDSRLNAYRADLAEERLRGIVEASRYVSGTPVQIAAPLASLRRAPREDAMQTTEALMGERAEVFESDGQWAWVKLAGDGYVGYMRASALGAEITTATHRISAVSTMLFPQPDLKSQPVQFIGMNAEITVTGVAGDYLRSHAGHYVFAGHAKPIDAFESDFVAVAERFLHVPYFWGGKSSAGLDCSGLLQLALQAAGIPSPRDADLQEEALGVRVDRSVLRRGDLVFWEGHAGIMRDAANLLHANGHHMMVVIEPLSEAVARIAAKGKEICAIKRLT
jgi:cell wall-associated NlpC family hydrolase